MIAIDPEILRAHRAHRGLSQAMLAEKSKVGVSTIKRIEAAGEVYQTRPLVAKRLADALGVSVDDLSGDTQDTQPEDRTRLSLGERQIKTFIDSETALCYEMVEHLYGISRHNQIYLAPLLFVLMAEGSLAWRRELLEEVDATCQSLYAVAKTAKHMDLAFDPFLEESQRAERASIEQRDVFGTLPWRGVYRKGRLPGDTTPFAEYLRMLARRLDASDIQIDIDSEIYGPDLLDYRIGEPLVAEVAGEDRLARYAVSWGHAKIDDIPEDLLGEDRAEERIAWMIARIPKAERKALERREQEREAFLRDHEYLSGTTDTALPPAAPC